MELHLINHTAVVVVKLRLQEGNLVGGEARMLQRRALGGIRADIGALAGRSGGSDTPGGQNGGGTVGPANDDSVLVLEVSVLLGGIDEVQLVDSQPHQALKGLGVVAALHDSLNEGGLTGGNAVLLGLPAQLLVILEGLRKDGAVDLGAGQGGVGLGGELLLELLAPLHVVVLHGDEDGVGQLIHVAMLEQGADDGVHCHIHRHALQIQPFQNHLAVLVLRCGGNYLLILVDLQFHAGVDVQGDHRGHCVVALIVVAGSAAHHDQCQAGRYGQGHPFFLARALLGRILFRHGNHNSFLRLTAGKDSLQVIGRGMGHCLLQAPLQLLVIHRGSSPSSWTLNFFSAR